MILCFLQEVINRLFIFTENNYSAEQKSSGPLFRYLHHGYVRFMIERRIEPGL